MCLPAVGRLCRRSPGRGSHRKPVGVVADWAVHGLADTVRIGRSRPWHSHSHSHLGFREAAVVDSVVAVAGPADDHASELEGASVDVETGC
jgi:hypothetical protein